MPANDDRGNDTPLCHTRAAFRKSVYENHCQSSEGGFTTRRFSPRQDRTYSMSKWVSYDQMSRTQTSRGIWTMKPDQIYSTPVIREIGCGLHHMYDDHWEWEAADSGRVYIWSLFMPYYSPQLSCGGNVQRVSFTFPGLEAVVEYPYPQASDLNEKDSTTRTLRKHHLYKLIRGWTHQLFIW